MRELLINILFTELIVFIGVYIAFYVHDLYKLLIPKSPFEEEDEPYQEEVYAPTHEEILDEGFIEQQSNYESRISDMKETLKTYGNPAVEIITDEYERNTERF